MPNKTPDSCVARGEGTGEYDFNDEDLRNSCNLDLIP